MRESSEKECVISISTLQEISKIVLSTYSKLSCCNVMMPTDEELHCKSVIKQFSEGNITTDEAECLANAILGMIEAIEKLRTLSESSTCNN